MSEPRRPSRPADVEIGAALRAKSVRFRSRPQTEVAFDVQPDGESESRQERRNLPDRVEPGVTYRDIEVTWRGAARLADLDVRPRRR